MGTRHLILVYYKGEYHIAQYGQWDGYPEGQGLVVLNFIRDPANLAKLQAAIDNKRLYVPTEAQVEEMNQKIQQIDHEHSQKRAAYRRRQDADAANASRSDSEDEVNLYDMCFSGINVVCPSLSRDTGARILQLVADATEPLPIQLEVDFIADQLYCEWSYVIDLDARVLEVYAGSAETLDQVDETAHTRFEDLNVPGPVATFTFDKLPKEHDFVEQCLEWSKETEGDEDEEEENKESESDSEDEDKPVVEGARVEA